MPDANTTISAVLPGGPGSILGTRVVRNEDPRMLTGAARYLADLAGAHADGRPRDVPVLHVLHVPSPMAHAQVRAVHIADAAAVPGVHAVWTAADLDVAPLQGFVPIHEAFAHLPLASDRVRYVGEPIAAVFAEERSVAADAAQLVWAHLEAEPVVVDPEQALAHDAPLLFPTRGHNRAVSEQPDAVVDLEAISATVVRGRYVNQRVAVVPMETDGCLAEIDADGRLTLWASTQMPHLLHRQLAAGLGLELSAVRVRTPQVGGGFGGKAGLHMGYVTAALAARRFGRAVMWSPWRSEDMVDLPHGRAQVQYAEAGFDTDHRLTGLRIRLVGDAGAYPGVGAALPGGTRRMAPGPYMVPAYQCDVVAAATNTTPVGAYRGAGRPEATALVERLMDQAARELKVDPVHLRLANLIPADAFPYRSATGLRYDSGDYAMALHRAVAEADYHSLRQEQAVRRERADRWQIGIGVACYVEVTASGNQDEYARFAVHADGSATIWAGTAAHGQGHATSYAMIVADRTGIPVDRIGFVDGDTDAVPRGGGTGGSRSLQLAGSATAGAVDTVIERARQLAARHLEASVDDVVVDTATGTVGVVGVPATALTWGQLAGLAAADAADDSLTLDAEHVFTQRGATFPFGAHISIVEVDVETGRTRMLRHVAVDDCGTVVSPLLVQGQQHGGIASGVGQALFEEVRYDEQGNPQTGNLADYGLPSAADMISFHTVSTQTPSPLNPLGAKGIGEAATIGSTPAIQNAVIDAVSHLGVRHIDMPCTAERVWRAVADAEAGVHTVWCEPPAVFAELRAAALAEALAQEIAAAAEGI